MKTQTRMASLSLLTILCLMLAVAPAMAGARYDNGPYNGTTDAWTINFGYVVSDNFTVNDFKIDMENYSFGVWELPGDVMSSVD